MEELDLKELLKYYIRKLPIILIITAIFTILGYIYTEYIQVPMYKGTTTIILVEENNDTSNQDITKDTITINEKLVTTYSKIIKSRRVLDQVKEELKLKRSISDLAAQISVSSIEETSIIEIIVTDTNNELATKIANKIAEIFKKEITEIYNLENISIIDKAIIEKKPYNVNEVKQIIIFTLGGILLSCIIIFIIYYFDNSIKNKKEIEEKLNIPVLGEIPIATKLNKKTKHKSQKEKISNESKIEDSSTTKQNKAPNTEKNKKLKKEKLKKESSKVSKESTTKKNLSKQETKNSTSKTTTKKESTKKPSSRTKKQTSKGGEE